MKWDIDSLMKELVSDDLEQQATALESVAELFCALSREAVKGLYRSSNPAVFTEKLSLLGSVVIGPLEEMIGTWEKSEKRTLASILLLQFGSRKGLDDVLEELRTGGDNAILAARKLVQSHILGAGNLIIDRLRKIPLSEIRDRANAPYINSLLAALEESNTPLPLDLHARFSAEDVPKEYPRRARGRIST